MVLQIRGGEMRLVAATSDAGRKYMEQVMQEDEQRNNYVDEIIARKLELGKIGQGQVKEEKEKLYKLSIDTLAEISATLEEALQQQHTVAQTHTIQPRPAEYRPHFKASEQEGYYSSGKMGDEVIKRFRDISRSI